jgi:FMN phosphatase YigB (HAD superfamily)
LGDQELLKKEYCIVTLALLLDLDDTLLDTNMQAFAPAYFSALAQALSGLVSSEQMLPALTAGTEAMSRNLDPEKTLRNVFDEKFFPQLGSRRSELQAKIDQFYDTTFPGLGHLTKKRQDAIDFVQWAFEKGFRIAIATNPFFPLKAVQHRLRWADLSPDTHRFDLISAYEAFHFTKENLAYFPELLGQLGWPDDPVLMVGNDLEMDILPASQAGLPVFWLKGEKDGAQSEFPQGDFLDLKKWIIATDPESMMPKTSTRIAILSVLRSTPAALSTIAHGLPEGAWECHPKPDEWCLSEVFCHLRDVEVEINIPRVKKILEEENPFLPGILSDVWATERNYALQDGRKALAEFIDARKFTLELLQDNDLAWMRRVRHSIFGAMTLQELVGFMAEHDRVHVQQVWKTIHG